MALDEVSWGAMFPKSLFSADFNIQVSPSAIVVTPPTVSGPKMPTISPSIPPQPSVTPGSPKSPGSGPIIGSAPIASGIAQKCPAVSEKNAQKLQAMIFSGDGTYNGSFLAQPAQGKYAVQAESTKLDTNTKPATEETILGLTQNAADAIPIFLDPANGVLTAWKRYTVDRYGKKNDFRPSKRDSEYKEVCETWGVGCASASSGNPVGNTVFSPSSGTSGMTWTQDRLSWEHPRFGSWLVCGTAAGPVLNFWNPLADQMPGWSNCGMAYLQRTTA